MHIESEVKKIRYKIDKQNNINKGLITIIIILAFIVGINFVNIKPVEILDTVFGSSPPPNSGLLIFSLSGKCPPSMRDVSSTLNNRFIMISEDDPSTTTSVNKPDQPTGCSGSDTPQDTQLGCETTTSNLYIGGSNKIHQQHLLHQHYLVKNEHWSVRSIPPTLVRGEYDDLNPSFTTSYLKVINFLPSHTPDSHTLSAPHDTFLHGTVNVADSVLSSVPVATKNFKGFVAEDIPTNTTVRQPHYPQYVRLKACVWGN